MRLSVLGLIGFTAFVLCPTTCPMNGEMASATNHAMHQEMHADNRDMHQNENQEPCEHCGVTTGTELALLQGTPLGIHIPLSLVSMTVPNTNVAMQPLHIRVPKSHLASAGPPVVPNIIRTVVLRT